MDSHTVLQSRVTTQLPEASTVMHIFTLPDQVFALSCTADELACVRVAAECEQDPAESLAEARDRAHAEAAASSCSLLRAAPDRETGPPPQIVPTRLFVLLSDPQPGATGTDFLCGTAPMLLAAGEHLMVMFGAGSRLWGCNLV